MKRDIGSVLKRFVKSCCFSALLLPVCAAAAQHGDFTYTVAGGAVTLSGYTGNGGAVTFPDRINGLPVTVIGRNAFQLCTTLTSVTIPEGVTTIGRSAFYACTALASVTVPASVTSIERSAFQGCTSLTSVSFKGNAPAFGVNVFFGDDRVVFYCMPGTTGWNTPIDSRSAKVWDPHVKSINKPAGKQGKHFGFTVAGTAGIGVVIEACSDLSAPVWTPVSTNVLVNGSATFSDPSAANHLRRFYRLRMP